MTVPMVYHPEYSIPWPEGHRFPMAKFSELYSVLKREGLISKDSCYTPSEASEETLLRVHDPAYVNRFLSGTLSARETRVLGLPWSQALVRRTRLEVGGTVLATKLALKFGLACQTAGGTHHAFPAHGSGYCALNDLAVAARWVLDRAYADKILILDLDVHQGDGTAAIFLNEPRVFTCSVHCQKNFPFRKQSSDLDVGLERGTGDEIYLSILKETLEKLFEKVQPNLVFYDAGVDVHQDDRLGHLNLSLEGIYQRDRLVLGACVARGVPVMAVIGGGYSKDINALAWRHFQLHRAAYSL